MRLLCFLLAAIVLTSSFNVNARVANISGKEMSASCNALLRLYDSGALQDPKVEISISDSFKAGKCIGFMQGAFEGSSVMFEQLSSLIGEEAINYCVPSSLTPRKMAYDFILKVRYSDDLGEADAISYIMSVFVDYKSMGLC